MALCAVTYAGAPSSSGWRLSEDRRASRDRHHSYVPPHGAGTAVIALPRGTGTAISGPGLAFRVYRLTLAPGGSIGAIPVASCAHISLTPSSCIDGGKLLTRRVGSSSDPAGEEGGGGGSTGGVCLSGPAAATRYKGLDATLIGVLLRRLAHGPLPL